ncbi:hypothetical protein QAD02_023569 [Eretmocerus hayati]|uniref:Uncharacterized protein n=1 Tax=Eretmocerus hayati TaxID=131215 RepID=A0ACC2PW06_9HYME|nr:hypothetical protein QAD02_023569 [Eretmocerus hayati]
MYKTEYFEKSFKKRSGRLCKVAIRRSEMLNGVMAPPAKHALKRPNPRQRTEARAIAEKWSKEFTAQYGQPVKFTWRSVYKKSREGVFQSALYTSYYSYQSATPSRADPNPVNLLSQGNVESIRDPRIRKRLGLLEVVPHIPAPPPSPPTQ